MMLINFDRSKYPADHEFEDIDPDNEDISIYDLEDFNSVYYVVRCKKCDMIIRHQEIKEIITAHLDPNIKHVYKRTCELFLVVTDEKLIELRDVSEINYEKVYSCAEVMIKNLLE